MNKDEILAEDIKITTALKEAGLDVHDVYDLVNTNQPYPEAVPVLIELLEGGVQHPALKEGVVRALAVKEAKGLACPALIREFKSLPEHMGLLRWVVANSIRAVLTREYLNDVIALIKDPRYGESRQNLFTAISKFKEDRVETLLIDLLHEPDLTVFAVEALGKMKSKKAVPLIQKLGNDSDPLVRKEVKKALKRTS